MKRLHMVFNIFKSFKRFRAERTGPGSDIHMGYNMTLQAVVRIKGFGTEWTLQRP